MQVRAFERYIPLDSSLYSIKCSVFFADMTFIHNKEINFLKLQNIWTYINDLKTIDVPRPLTNDLWVFLFQTIDAECVKWASLDGTYVYAKAFK